MKHVGVRKGKMKQSLLFPTDRIMRKFSNPCRSIDSIQYTYSEAISKYVPKGFTQMNFHFTTQYKETKQHLQINFEV